METTEKYVIESGIEDEEILNVSAVSEEQFFKEIHAFLGCKYHPDVWMRFYVDGKKVYPEDFIDEKLPVISAELEI